MSIVISGFPDSSTKFISFLKDLQESSSLVYSVLPRQLETGLEGPYKLILFSDVVIGFNKVLLFHYL